MRHTLFASMLLAVSLASLPALAEQPRAAGPAPVAMPRLPLDMVGSAAPLLDDRPDAASRRDKAPLSVRAILLMCDFADSLLLGRHGLVAGDFPPPMQDEISYRAHDAVYFDHLMQDVADYYSEASNGRFELAWTVHPRAVNLSRGMAWYGHHPEEDEQPVLMAAEVVDSLDAEIDFSLYDTVILVHAGAGEETDVARNSPENVYSTYLDPDDFEAAYEDTILAQPWLQSADFPPGEGITRVLVLPETLYQDPDPPNRNGMFGSLGVYAYEMGLRLGMLPLVDFTPVGHADSQGIGTFGLMGYGLFVFAGWSPPPPCAYNRALMGWIDPVVAEPGAGAVHELTPAGLVDSPRPCVRVELTGQEYWLAEYRLQDPDGDRFWSFGGDLNGDFRRNFWDASEADGRPQAGAKFDPAEDTRERIVGAEWDFFTTDFATGVGGNGSGVLVWHVDEGVIDAVFDAPSALFNADASRKAVDLEEADGVQDLDSSSYSNFYLGSDADAFRGEGTTLFGPDALPRTDTNSGVRTGIVFDEFSPVVDDPQAYIAGIYVDDSSGTAVYDTLWGYVYADTVSFRLAFQDEVTGPRRGAERVFPDGVDLRGSHLLTADLDLLGRDEIVAADRAGGVHVLTGDLLEFMDLDANPDTYAPFATGLRGGAPVAWNLPPAVGNLDDDPAPEIVLTSADGLFAFDRDGSAVRDIEPGATGLYVDLGACALPPVLLAGRAGPVPEDPGLEVPISAVVIVQTGSDTFLRSYSGDNGDLDIEHDLGPVLVRAPPVLAFERLWVATTDTVTGVYALAACLPPHLAVAPGTPAVRTYDLGVEPGAFPVAWGLVDPGEPASRRWIAVAGRNGGGETLILEQDLDPAGATYAWPAEVVVRSPLAPGAVFTAADVLGRVGLGGDWEDGWPRRLSPDLPEETAPWAGGPLVARIIGAVGAYEDYLFPLRDGRLAARGPKGEELDGWPLAIPARTAGTPALGDLGGVVDADLVAVAAIDRITGMDEQGENLTHAVRSVLTVWQDVAVAGGSWPMWGGTPWRNGSWPAETWRNPGVVASGSGIVAGSHICYPSPLTEGTLQVRARLRQAGRVRVEIYDLEGERIVSTGWRDVPAGEPFSVPVELDRLVSGLYLCRLVARDGGGDDHSVVSFAVVR
ncbi:MAG: hypothetical protein GY838_17610 [bacterium]|nr:hypothetical protein [bacterium]